MRISSMFCLPIEEYGFVQSADMLMDAGFTALDMTIDAKKVCVRESEIFTGDYKSLAQSLRDRAESRGVVYNQSHAPFPSEKFYDILPRSIEFASLLGAKTIVVHPIHDVEYRGNEESLFIRNMEFYNSLVPYARDFKIKIGIENMWQRHRVTGRICDTTCADPKKLIRYYDTLKSEGVFTVCLDVGHAALCGREPENVIREIGGERIGAIHIHDVDYIEDLHTVPGVGKINFDAVCRALADINYSGDMTLEVKSFLDGFDKEFYPEALAFMAKCALYLKNKIIKYKSEKDK